MNKRFVLAGICLFLICLSLSAYILNKNGRTNRREKLNLNNNEIQKINISVYPPILNGFDVSDKKQVKRITDYLTSLDTSETKLNPGDYNGGGYLIKLYLKSGDTRELILSGNRFLVESNKFKYEIPYKEATEFDIIVAGILEENESKTGESSIAGRIVSLNSEASGRNISCIINDKNNRTYNINVTHASIIDATGNGMMLLRQNDIVKVFYRKDIDGVISAVTVYIKATTK